MNARLDAGCEDARVTRSLASYAARLAAGWDARFGAERSAVLEGTLVKVDLSGFTRLSERLARASRFGAEELNAVLNDVFGTLISIAHEHGGDILQFGGDALLVWFEGDEAARRAALATWLQQRAIVERPAERTPAGPVRLRMSAGIASGSFAFAVVGSEHRELVVHGPDASRTLALERVAPSGGVLVDEATAAELGPGCCRRSGDAHRLIRGPAPPRHLVRTGPSSEHAAEFVPGEVRAIEELGTPAGEHRRAVGAFITVHGLDAASPVAALERLDAVTTAVEAACARFQVCWTAADVAEDGAVFLVFAGAPVAREREDERMLRACRAVLAAVPGLPVRIGINAGPVFAGDIGATDRRTFAVIGDTTNLAARLMVAAEPGTIRVARSVVERAGTHTWTDIGSVAVKGRRARIDVAVLGEERPVPVSRRTHDLPLLGRDAELALLEGTIDRTLDGIDDAVMIVGEAGTGKSRIVAEAVAVATRRGVRCAVASSVEEHAATPYAAVRPLLIALLGDDVEPLAAALGDEAPYLPLLAAPLGIRIADTPESRRLDPMFVEQRRLSVLLAALAITVVEPTMIVFEDAHWSDRASLAVVAAIAAGDELPLSVVVTSRPPAPLPAGSGTWQPIELAPLGPAPARALVLSAAGDRALTDARLDRLVRDAHGNALFLRELAVAASGDDASLPDSADEVIAARIDALPASDRTLLRHAAVAGSVTPLAVLGAVLHDPDVATPHRWERLADFVTIEGDCVRFRHDLYRRGAAQALSVRTRRAVHAGVATALLDRAADSPPEASLLALHLHGAGRYAEAFDWSLAAARRARDDGAFADAADQLGRAVDAGERAGTIDPERLLATRLEAAELHELVGQYDWAVDEIGRVARVRGWTCGLLVMRATVLERAGRATKALRSLRRAERTDATPVEHVDRLLCTSSTLGRLGRLRAAADAAERALGLAGELGDRRREALALLRLEMFASELGDPIAREYGQRSHDLLVELGDDRNLGNVLLNLGVTAKDTDDWAGAVRRYLASADAYSRAGDAVGRAFALNNLAEIRLDQGQLDRAERDVLEARRIFRANGQDLGAAATMSSLGTIAARRGRHDEAREWLASARDALAAAGADLLVVDAALRQVETEVLAGATVDARRVLGEAAGLAARVGDVGILDLSLRRWAAVLDGDAAMLEEVAADALAHGAVLERLLCCDALATLRDTSGRPDEASQWRSERDHLADSLAITTFARS